MKICTKCGEAKPTDAFYPEPRGKDGLRSSCIVCENARSKAWQATNVEEWRASRRKWELRTKFGITPEEYDEMLETQEGGCACCGANTPGGKHGGPTSFCVDHDHTTGAIRGLLCNACNLGIGKFGETAEGVANALFYLLRATGAPLRYLCVQGYPNRICCGCTSACCEPVFAYPAT